MANTVYANKVLESKLEDLLTTHLDMNSFLTVDNDLAESAGMTKTVNVYSATGNVADLAQGAGNTANIEVGFTGVDYTVGVTQGRFQYYDEEAMKDPMIVEMGLKAIADKMTNDLNSKAITALGSATGTGALSQAGA